MTFAQLIIGQHFTFPTAYPVAPAIWTKLTAERAWLTTDDLPDGQWVPSHADVIPYAETLPSE